MTGEAWNALTPREGAVLAAVGRHLDNRHIADELGISVRTVESHTAALRRKLGAGSRAALVEAAHRHRGHPVRLPQNSFVGRDDELARVCDLLREHRWVTLVGAPGCGKTRAALELASASAGWTPLVVELEDATPERVVAAVSKVVGLGAVDGPVVDACALALGEQPHLLVLDNCDRVAGAVAGLLRELLPAARSLRVLATSRSPVGGSDETVVELRPLTPEAAARLFVDRSRAVAADGRLDPDRVREVCLRLDGLPLAVELAAAQVRHLPVEELADQLAHGLAALERTAAAPDRHRTLQAAIAWTHDLLDEQDRAVLTRLACLPRTFDVELAQVVAGPDAGRAVMHLLDRSLVSRTFRPSTPVRFRLLGAVRAFVAERTDATVLGALHEEVGEAHASYHAGRADRVRRRARRDDSRELAEEAKRLCPEINAGIAWALARGRAHLALPLARALAVGGEQFSPDLDSLGSIARVARDPACRRAATAEELLDLGVALAYGDLDLVEELARLALQGAEDPPSRLAAHHLAGVTEAYRDRGRAALEHLDVAERLADELLDPWQLASVRQMRGIALQGSELDDPVAATDAFASAMATFALAGDAMHVNNARYMMAAAAVGSGDGSGPDRARATAWVEECVSYGRRTGNRHELAHALLTRARLGSGPDAGLGEALEAFRVVGDLRCLTRGHLLRAAWESTPDEREGELAAALASARAAHDLAHQATVLEALVRARWEADRPGPAAEAYGALVALVGADAAASRCPAALTERLPGLQGRVAEGVARG